MEEIKDPELWRIAKKRAGFKSNLVAYVIVNSFLWLIWYYTGGEGNPPWPVWSMFGWGLGLAFNYYSAYHGDKNTMIEREYDKLKREKQAP